MKRILATAAFLAAAAPALAQVSVNDPWVRATVPQQKTTGAFMRITAAKDSRLVAVQSPLAGTVEIHEMKMENNVMKMRAVAGIDLPAGKTVELAPSGYHVMLMDLKQPMKEGESVPLTLVVEGKDKKRETVEIKAQVRPLNASGKNAHMH
jgi:copper(I)-binding protein